jgi:hypothetical protein
MAFDHGTSVWWITAHLPWPFTYTEVTVALLRGMLLGSETKGSQPKLADERGGVVIVFLLMICASNEELNQSFKCSIHTLRTVCLQCTTTTS